MVPRRYGLISITFLTDCEACLQLDSRRRTNIRATGCTRVYSDNDTFLELEGKRGGTMHNVDATRSLRRRVMLQKGNGLGVSLKSYI